MIKLSKEIWASKDASRRDKLLTMKRRQAALCAVARAQLTEKGYRFGRSLSIPGAYAFETMADGRSIRLGVKTSSDRWVGVPKDSAGGYGVLSNVDEVFVVTFDNVDDPKRLQIIQFDPEVLVQMAEQVYREAARLQQTGQQWIPLDEYADRHATGMIAGGLARRGEVIFDDAIQWGADEPPSPPGGLPSAPLRPVPSGSPSQQNGMSDEKPQAELASMDQVKAVVARLLGVPIEKVEIDIRLKL